MRHAIVLLSLLATPAFAAPEKPSCTATHIPKDALTSRPGGVWATVTPAQYHFLEGVYVLNPRTPAGLPPGDSAVFAKVGGDKGGVVFWMRNKGAEACNAMAVPEAVVKLMNQIVEGKDNTDGDGDPI